MTQGTTANTDIEGVTPTQKALFGDALDTCKEAQVTRLENFIRWNLQDSQSTVLEFPYIRLPEPTATTVDLPIVVNILTAGVPSRKHQIYRQSGASTSEETEQEPSTAMQQELTKYVENTIGHLFESAEEEYFEDGMESDFSRELASQIKKYGNLAMSEITYLLTYGRVDKEVASNALCWLGRIDDPSTYDWRLWILEKSLSSNSPILRDGAGLGLACMGDAHAIKYIRKAIEQETITELHDDLQGVLEELEASLDATPAKGN